MALVEGQTQMPAEQNREPELIPTQICPAAVWPTEKASQWRKVSFPTSGAAATDLELQTGRKRSLGFTPSFFFFVFLGPHPQHMRFPGSGLKNRFSCQPTPQPQPCQIRAMSATYTTAHGNSRSLTYWARPGIEPTSSWILVGFVTAELQQELQPSQFIHRLMQNDLGCKIENYKTFRKKKK